MSDTIPLIYILYSYRQVSGNWGGSVNIWVDPSEHASSAPIRAYSETGAAGLFHAAVVDRADPTKTIFEGVLTNNTDVPAALAAALTPKNMLIFTAVSSVGYGMGVPQGDLYKALVAAGAGVKLRNLEKLAYYKGCGMMQLYWYTLLSIPGAEIAGFERSGVPDTVYSTTNDVSSVAGHVENIFVDLVPSASGYVPVVIE